MAETDGSIFVSPDGSMGTPIAPATTPGLPGTGGKTIPLSSAPLSDEQILDTMRNLAVLSIPQRAAMQSEAIRRQTALAAGSSAALRRTMLPQITALRQRLESAFDALNARLGPNAGRQIERGKVGALTEAGAGLQQLFAGGQQQGFAQLLGMLQSFRPAQLAQLPQPTTQTGPFDPSAFGALGSSTAGLIDAIYSRPPSATTTAPAMTTAANTELLMP